jgi:hypothetical protein
LQFITVVNTAEVFDADRETARNSRYPRAVYGSVTSFPADLPLSIIQNREFERGVAIAHYQDFSELTAFEVEITVDVYGLHLHFVSMPRRPLGPAPLRGGRNILDQVLQKSVVAGERTAVSIMASSPSGPALFVFFTVLTADVATLSSVFTRILSWIGTPAILRAAVIIASGSRVELP